MGMEQGGYSTDQSGDQGSYDYGGGGDFNIGMGAGGDSFAVDYASQYGGALDYYGDYGSDFNYGYGAGESSPVGGSGDLFDAYTQYYEDMGFDTLTAMELASIEAQQGSIQTITSEHELLPDLQQYYELPYVENYNPWDFQPYTPIFEDLPPPLPPTVTPQIPLTVAPPPQVPMTPTNPYGAVPKAPGLPPPCPVGQYHPFPIGHPDQNKCIPFPPAQVSKSPAPVPARSAGGGASGGGSTQKPPTQQKPPAQQTPIKCAPGQYYSQRLKRCVNVPKCVPGFTFDPVLEACVRTGTQTSPLPSPGGVGAGGSIADLLKNTPPWLWAALLAALFLAMSGDDKKRATTRRAA